MMEKSNTEFAAKRARDGGIRAGRLRKRTLRSCKRKDNEVV